MKAQILSLNIGSPAPMEWNGKSVLSSMRKTPVPGPLSVSLEHIEGNTFANPAAHGIPDFLLYAYGAPSILSFLRGIGRTDLIPGEVGETLTLSDFDETRISVGDIFQVGEVIAQACFPRIPCGKVNYCVRHERGQQAMQECGRSGVYLRILNPGKIHATDRVEFVEKARETFPIFEVYQMVLNPEKVSPGQIQRARANGAFPKKYLARWKN